MPDQISFKDPNKQAIGVNEALHRDLPQAIETLDILREGSYFFYDFLDTPLTVNSETEQRYTKDVYPLFNMKYINNPDYWDLISIITEDIPFYHLEPSIEQTVVDKEKQFKLITSTGIDLGSQLSIDNYRDPGITDVPAPLQNSEFWSAWLRDTIGYYENKLILDVYNKLQYPLLNEHLYLNATLFPDLAYSAYRNATSAETNIQDILSFKDIVTDSDLSSLDDIGTPAYIEELISSRLESIYRLLDYSPLSAQILMDWADSLYEVGMLPGSALEKEKTIYRLQDIKHELLKRKFAGTATLYQLTLRALNRNGSFISAVPASTIGNSKASYSVFNELRNVRLINLPGLSSSPVTNKDLPIDYLREFYTRPIEEGSGREIPLDILYPLFCSASQAVNYSLTCDESSTEDEYFYNLSGVSDPAQLLVSTSYKFSPWTSDPVDPLKGALRSANSSLVWDALTGLSLSQSISTIWTTLDEKIYEETEEEIETNAYLHLDPTMTRNAQNELVGVIHTLDERNPYANLTDVTGHMLDLSADTLMYHENTFQKKLEDSYEYLTYPITDNLSVSLMDSPWLSYLQQTTDRKSRLQEDIQVGVQISSFNNIDLVPQTEFPFFIWSTGINGNKTAPATNSENTDSVYLWFAILKYFTNELYFQPKKHQVEYHLMTKIHKAGVFQSSQISEPENAVKKALYQEWQHHNVGLMPMVYPYLTGLAIDDLQYGLVGQELIDDFTDKEYTKAYFLFSNSGAQPGKHLKNSAVQPEFLNFADIPLAKEQITSGDSSAETSEENTPEFLSQYSLQVWPEVDTKTVFYILKKEDLENPGSYKYSWSDPVPVFSYQQLSDNWTSEKNLGTEENPLVQFFPDWWGLTYYLNPYLNFIQDSASPIRNKQVLGDYRLSGSVLGPSGISALSNLARKHHNEIVCNDNGLLSVFHHTEEIPALNDQLNLQVNNPHVIPGSENEDDQKQATALMGMYLDHNYKFISGAASSIEEIESWSIAQKQNITTPVKIYGDNRDLSLYDTSESTIFTDIHYGNENLPCLTFARPLALSEFVEVAKVSEYLSLNYKSSKKFPDLVPSSTNTWCWQPGEQSALVFKQLYGFTVCLNLSFNFEADEKSYFAEGIITAADNIDRLSEEDRARFYRELPLARESQTLLDQPGRFSLERKVGGKIKFTVYNLNGPNDSSPSFSIDSGSYTITTGDKLYHITASATVEQQDRDSEIFIVLTLIINNRIFTEKYHLSNHGDDGLTFKPIPNTPIYIGAAYEAGTGTGEFNFKNHFYGDLYDLRCYTVGFSPSQLLMLNSGTLAELYSYGPASYKIAYSVYKDPSIFKVLTQGVPDWSVKKVRVFSRSVWDSILPDLYPQSMMEVNAGYWQYLKNHYDPYTDTDIYKKYYNLDLDLTPQQAALLADTADNQEKRDLLASWNLTLPRELPRENFEYNDCVEQTLKDRAEVINSSSPIGFPDEAHPESVIIKYRGQDYTVRYNDTVSIINTTIYPVQYEHWPYISFNPEENITPSLSVDLTTGAISTQAKRGFYLPTTVVSVDDTIEYNADLDINFRVSPDMNAVRNYSHGDNVIIRYNEDLQVTQAVLSSGVAEYNSSSNNHILFPMAIPRQKNLSSEQVGYLTRFYLKNLSLNSAFKHFLTASSYYTELYIPIPYSEPNTQDQISFGSRWHALRTLKEGSYYFTCKYPVQIIPLLDKDFDSIPNQASIITSYLTVRFKIEVSGQPYLPVQGQDNEIFEFRLKPINTANELSARHKAYLSSSLKETLSNPTRLYNPKNNLTFPHRKVTINLFTQDYINTGVEGKEPEDYIWTLIGTNDPAVQRKFGNVLLLDRDTLEKPELNLANRIPAFLQKNYQLPFFIAAYENGEPNPSRPVADNFSWTIDPMGNSASIECLTASSEAEYSNLQLVAGHAYKVLLDYTGKITELSFDDGASKTTEQIKQILTDYIITPYIDMPDGESKQAAIQQAYDQVIDLSSSLKSASLEEESTGYSRLVNLLSSSMLANNILLDDFCYTTSGTSIKQNVSNLLANFSGYQVDLNAAGQEIFKPVSVNPEPLNPGDTTPASPQAFYLGDPYSRVRSQNYKLYIANNSTTAPTDINQAYTFPYVIENYTASNLFTVYPRKTLPVIIAIKKLFNTFLFPRVLSGEQPINETDLLAALHTQLMNKLNAQMSSLVSDPSGLIAGISDISPDITYPVIHNLHAKYSYIKSANEDLLGYSALSRQLSLNTAPFSLVRSSLYTGNLFANRNLFDNRYWARGSALSDGATATSLVGNSTYILTPDTDWFNGKDVFEWKYTPLLTSSDSSETPSGKILLTLAYTPTSTSTVQDPLEIYMAIRIQKAIIENNTEVITDLDPASAGLTVIAQLSRGSRTIDALYTEPGSDVEKVNLVAESTPLNGCDHYYGYKAMVTPAKPCDRLSFIIAVPASILSQLTNGSLKVRIGKVSVRRYKKNLNLAVGLSSALKYGANANTNESLYLGKHSIVLFKNKYNAKIITPVQFNGQIMKTIVDPVSNTVISRALTTGSIDADAFIDRYHLRKLGPYSPYTLLAKPWVRKLVLTHQYVNLESAAVLGDDYLNQSDAYRSFADKPIRCSSTQAEIHKYEIDVDQNGVRYLLDKGQIYDIYQFKKSTAGDGVTYSDSKTMETTAAFFEIRSGVDPETGVETGLFLAKDSVLMQNFSAVFNSNLQVDDTPQEIHRYYQVTSADSEVDDTYGTFSISNEKLSLLTSTFNTKNFSQESNRQAIDSSPVLVTNVQLLNTISDPSSDSVGNVNQILYEYEFLPIIYDEKGQHLSLNYFLRYGTEQTTTESPEG